MIMRAVLYTSPPRKGVTRSKVRCAYLLRGELILWRVGDEAVALDRLLHLQLPRGIAQQQQPDVIDPLHHLRANIETGVRRLCPPCVAGGRVKSVAMRGVRTTPLHDERCTRRHSSMRGVVTTSHCNAAPEQRCAHLGHGRHARAS